MVGNKTPEVPRWFAALLDRNALVAGVPSQGKTFALRRVLLAELDESRSACTRIACSVSGVERGVA